MYYSLISLVCLFSAGACSEYDDAELLSSIEDLQDRVTSLESYVGTLNSQVSAIQTAVSAIETPTTVTTLSTNTDGSYTIVFSNGTSFTISSGTDGYDGTDGSTPVIGVTLIDDVYYWTLDGELIVDSNGDYIRASAYSESGETTPTLKIENGFWYVSYDDGESWTVLGEVAGQSVQYITGVSSDDSYVYITLYDGTVLTLSKKESLGISIDLPIVGVSEAGETVEVTYTLTGADSGTTIKVLAENGYSATVTASSTSSGTISITAPDPLVSGEVTVFVSDGVTTLMRVITLKAGGFISVTTTTGITVAGEGGTVEIPVTTNVDYTVSFGDDTWLSYTETRADQRSETLVLTAEANIYIIERTATVTLTSTDGSVVESVIVTQEGGSPSVVDEWSVEYVSRTYYEDFDRYYDRVDFDNNSDGSLFITEMFIATYVDAITVDSLFNAVQAILDAYISVYDEAYYDGYYIGNYAYNTPIGILYSLSSSTQYYGVLFEVTEGGILTGRYKMSDKFTPETVTASSAYKNWIGTWTVTGANSTTGKLIFQTGEANMNYNMYQTSTNFPPVEVDFNPSDGSVTFVSVDTGEDTEVNSAACDIYWWGLVNYNSNDVYIASTGYDISSGTLNSDLDTGTITALEVGLNIGTYSTVAMGYAIYSSSTGYVYTYSGASSIYFPATITLGGSTTSLSTSTVGSTGTKSFWRDTAQVGNILEVNPHKTDLGGFRYVELY